MRETDGLCVGSVGMNNTRTTKNGIPFMSQAEEDGYDRGYLDAQKESIETRLLELEQRAISVGVSDSVPGTILQRVFADIKWADEQKIKFPHSCRTYPDGFPKQSVLLWVVGIGGLNAPKIFEHGYTIEEAITAAENALAKAVKENR